MSMFASAVLARPVVSDSIVPRAIWIAFLSVGLSFPVASLFEEADEVTMSIFVIPALVSLPILAVLCYSERQSPLRGSLAISCALALAFNIGAGLLLFDRSDPEKLYRFGATLMLFGVMTACIFGSARAMRVIDLVFVILGLTALGALVVKPGQFDAGRLSYGDSNPIWMARAIGLLAIGSAAYVIKHPRYMALGGAGVIAAIAGIVLTASRGPLLALLISLSLGAVFFRYKNKFLLMAAGTFAALGLGTVLFGWDLLGTNRLLDFSGGYDESANLRSMLYDYAVYMIGVTPDGIGVGNFEFLSFPYPHNVYLEVLLEWGWLFGSMFILAIALGFFGILRLPEEYNVLKMLFVFEVINSGLSGDITSPRFLYGLAILGNAFLLSRLWSSRRSRPVSNARPA